MGGGQKAGGRERTSDCHGAGQAEESDEDETTTHVNDGMYQRIDTGNSLETLEGRERALVQGENSIGMK